MLAILMIASRNVHTFSFSHLVAHSFTGSKYGLQLIHKDLASKSTAVSSAEGKLPSTCKTKEFRSISFGGKYKVTYGLHDEKWLVRRPRIWQEKVAGILHCYLWSNTTQSWKPNTFVRYTTLLTSTGGSMGRGLFAMRDFAEDEVIGHYVGAIVGTADRKDDLALRAYVQGRRQSVTSVY